MYKLLLVTCCFPKDSEGVESNSTVMGTLCESFWRCSLGSLSHDKLLSFQEVLRGVHALCTQDPRVEVK